MVTESRTFKIEIKPTAEQKRKIDALLAACRNCYNDLVRYAKYLKKNHHPVLACLIRYSDGACCPLGEKPSEGIHPGRELVIDPVITIDTSKKTTVAKPALLTLSERISMLNEGNSPWNVLQSIYSQKFCNFPQEHTTRTIEKGKRKGEQQSEISTGQIKKIADYGISAKSANRIARAFKGQIKATITNRKNGNIKAQSPYKFKGYYPWLIDKKEIHVSNNKLSLGSKKYGVTLSIPELPKPYKFIAGEITRERDGSYFLHLSYKFEFIANPNLTNIGAVDLGQKRAMVIAAPSGETATISGANICAIKRTRDRRYREINRLRSRTYRGQIRQYLSSLEQQKAWHDTRYGWRMIRQRRREGKHGSGRSLVELGQQIENKPLRKRSKREWDLYQASQKVAVRTRKALDYANHCITKIAVDWCQEKGIGKLYVGDLNNIPKRRKKGKRRIKQVKRNSLWEWPTQVKYLNQKLVQAGGAGTQQASERLTSQTCPSCGARNKPKKRVYRS